MKKKVMLFILSLFVGAFSQSVTFANNERPNENYNFTKKQKNIVYNYDVNSELSIDDSVSISKVGFSFAIDNYYDNFYKISNYSIYNDYYVYMPNDQSYSCINVIGMIIIPNNSNHMFFCKNINKQKHILEIIYEKDGELFIDFMNLQDDSFEYVNEVSQVIYDINDDTYLSNEILDILNYERHYLLSQLSINKTTLSNSDYERMMIEQERSVYNPCNSAETVSYRQFDNYTSNKGALDILLNSEDARDAYKIYRNNYTSCSQASDTMIVNVIPRQLFINEGIYSYIGTCYGFSIKTVESSGDYTSDFIIFEIKSNKNTMSENGLGSTMVKPVFKGYADCDGATGFISQIYDGSKLVLANIDLNLSLSNENELNIGDSGYCPYSDYGFYFSTYTIKYNARTSKKGSFDGKYLRYVASALGYIPKVGNLIKWTANGFISLGESYYNSNMQSDYDELLEDGSGNYVINKNAIFASTNASDMISIYGNLIKGIDTKLVKQNGDSEDTIPLLYDVNDSNCMEIIYSVGRKSDSVFVDALLETRLSLDIYEDNTSKILGFGVGSVDLQDRVNNAWAEHFNPGRASSTNSIAIDTPTEVEYSYDGYQIYNFTPISTGVYDIETYGTKYDTVLELYINNSFVTDDDNNGLYVNENGQSICSLIRVTLTQNYTYTIKVMGKNGSAGYTNLIVKRYGNSLTEQISSTGFSTFYGYSVWQYFIPTRSDIFDIFTVDYNDITDTYIELYDSNHNLIAFSDSYDGCSHGKISLYLEEGETYIVRTKHMGSVYSERSFGVVIIREDEVDEMPSNMYFESHERIQKGGTDVIVYSFKPKYNATYNFYTEYSSGTKDVVMYLLDRDFNQIDFNDDGNGNLQPLISYNCLNYKTYYIMIKHYSGSNGNWTWFNFVVEEN